MTTITETEPDTGHDRDLSPTLWRIPLWRPSVRLPRPAAHPQLPFRNRYRGRQAGHDRHDW
jgi:hypothetical protein